MRHNHDVACRILEFAERVNTLTGWTLTPSVIETGVLFDCEIGSIFYPWRIIDEMDADTVAAAINAAREAGVENHS